MELSILIPTLPERIDLFNILINNLNEQIRNINAQNKIEILVDNRGRDLTIGKKRNDLKQKAQGKNLVYIDDDDLIAHNYIIEIMKALRSEPDCLSLRGIITTDNSNPEIFEHSIKYNNWETTEGSIKYLRMPNHLNVIRTCIAKQIDFPEINFGEDHAYSIALRDSGLLKNEFYIDQILYYYKYVTKK